MLTVINNQLRDEMARIWLSVRIIVFAPLCCLPFCYFHLYKVATSSKWVIVLMHMTILVFGYQLAIRFISILESWLTRHEQRALKYAQEWHQLVWDCERLPDLQSLIERTVITHFKTSACQVIFDMSHLPTLLLTALSSKKTAFSPLATREKVLRQFAKHQKCDWVIPIHQAGELTGFITLGGSIFQRFSHHTMMCYCTELQNSCHTAVYRINAQQALIDLIGRTADSLQDQITQHQILIAELTNLDRFDTFAQATIDQISQSISHWDFHVKTLLKLAKLHHARHFTTTEILYPEWFQTQHFEWQTENAKLTIKVSKSASIKIVTDPEYFSLLWHSLFYLLTKSGCQLATFSCQNTSKLRRVKLSFSTYPSGQSPFAPSDQTDLIIHHAALHYITQFLSQHSNLKITRTDHYFSITVPLERNDS